MAQTAKILVVGTGSIGERHVRCLQRTGRAEIAICEIQPTLREEVAARYGIRQAYADLDSALAASFDGAVICTPAHRHIAQAIQLAEAGVHLLIEKPLSVSLDRVSELGELLEAKRLSAGVAYVLRVHPALSAMKRALDEERFGPPAQVVVNCGQHFPTYRPAYRDIYYARRDTGGGAVQDALTHTINAAEWLVGPVQQLVADTGHQLLEGVDVEDTVHVIARHGAVMGSYSLNQYQAPNEVQLSVVCQRGTIRFEAHESRWRWQTEPTAAWRDESWPDLERDDLFQRQAARFLDVLCDRSTPLCTLDEAVATLRVNLAILASSESRSWIQLG